MLPEIEGLITEFLCGKRFSGRMQSIEDEIQLKRCVNRINQSILKKSKSIQMYADAKKSAQLCLQFQHRMGALNWSRLANYYWDYIVKS